MNTTGWSITQSCSTGQSSVGEYRIDPRQEQLQKFLNFIATFNPTLVCYAGKFLLCSTFCSSCAVHITRRSSSGESLFQTNGPSRLLLQERLSHPSPQSYNLGHQQLTFGGKLPLKYQVLLLWPSHSENFCLFHCIQLHHETCLHGCRPQWCFVVHSW